LPYDGLAYVIADTDGEFEWPGVTACLAETVPWRVETARLFGRNMPVPRMTAWFGDADYTYSGIHHRAAPFPAVVQRLRERADLADRTMRFCSISIEMAATVSAGIATTRRVSGNRPTIASLSLGATRRFQFRHRRTKETIPLVPPRRTRP
jgi:alkylated DNA repair dioxygenase AlkB